MKKPNKVIEETDEEFEEDSEMDEDESDSEESQEVRTEAKEKSKDRWTIGQVAKETEDVLVDNSTGKAYNQLVAIAMIMNTLEDIKKLLK